MHRYIDELAPVYIVFRTPLVEEDVLKSYLARLAVNVDAFAFSTAPSSEQDAKTPPPKEQIYGETIKPSTEPVIVRHEDGTPYTYVIWRIEVFICRPRGRFHKPAIYFQPTASMKPAERPERSIVDDEYLPSGMPAALNLLQSFESDPALAGINPRLSALRINKIAPSTPVYREMTRPIRTGHRRLFRALPALIWRIRYSKIQASLSHLSLMAALDLEVAYITAYRINIQEISLSLEGGDVTVITGLDDSSLVHKPGDQLTYLYKITPELGADGTPIFGKEGHILGLNIKANVLVSEGCQPVVNIAWHTAVDFMSDHNTNLIKAAHRLSTASNTSVQQRRSVGPDSLPAPDAGEGNFDRAIQVTFTISGPPKVQVGETFVWKAFIFNRSDRTRQLAVLVLPKRKRDMHRSHPSTSSAGGRHGDSKALLANAVEDENFVYAKQKGARLEAADLVCLTTDIRIGHLVPGACYTADIKFIALSAGVLSVEGLRIIDLATNETIDIRDLPAVVAAGKEGGK
ncbi:unnamed protein product [Periconia digitata]|uniref:Trafficking protein particle complex II-specific subunit 65 IgD3 domain-containing protein n=1 Tax=Periconia digitata TaxID=1303443 RepID=A0A9W4U3C7_9PLEO|nr:unnamed protein product [Periconia digitata]